MTFAVWTKDDARHGSDVRAVEQNFGSFAAVAADSGAVSEGVKSPGRRSARQAKSVEAAQQQIAPLAISNARRFEEIRRSGKRSQRRPLRRR